jgi:hypothetical protein
MYILVTSDKPQLRRTINVSALAAQFQADPVTFDHVLQHLLDTSPPLQALAESHDFVLSYVDRGGEQIEVAHDDAVIRHPHALAFRLTVAPRRGLTRFAPTGVFGRSTARLESVAWGKWLIVAGALGVAIVLILAALRFLRDDESGGTATQTAGGSPTGQSGATSTARVPTATRGPGTPAPTPPPQANAFTRTWERADRPIVEGRASRPWVWGPEPFAEQSEEYVEAQAGQRTVQYYDKARMELTGGGSVSLGLLVLEMAAGRLQLGDSEYAERDPAAINLAGDPDDVAAPTYATVGRLLEQPAAADGAALTLRIDRLGNVSDDPGLVLYNVTAAQRVPVGGREHQIASVFWQYLTSTAVVYQDGDYSEAPLFPSPLEVTGLPITEAYWANIKVGGSYQDVLVQCFERRCLTYTPLNQPPWQVESNNVGRHYYEWRYGAPAP